MSERPVSERNPAEKSAAETTFVEACVLVATGGAARVIDWELARLKAIMPRVVSRAMSFSAMSCFDDALIASVQRFYGLDVDVATAETEVLEDDIERVRFFPWFLWDFRMDRDLRSPTVGERFLLEGDVSEVERRVLHALCDTVVEFWEVVAKSPTGVSLEALGMGGEVTLEDDVLARELSIGQILQGRIVVVAGEDGQTYPLIDAIYAVLPPSTRSSITAELGSVLGDDHPSGERDALRCLLKAHTPELVDFAEYALEIASEPPVSINLDGETIVLCSTVVPSGSGLALEAALVNGELPFVLEPGLGDATWTWIEGAQVIGFVVHDAVRGRWVAGAASRERLARLTGRLAEASIGTPALHMEETLERAATSWVETGAMCWHLSVDPEVRQAFEQWLSCRWVDVPHPKLGDLSPREAASNPTLGPTLGLALEGLMSHLEALVGRPLRHELGL